MTELSESERWALSRAFRDRLDVLVAQEQAIPVGERSLTTDVRIQIDSLVSAATKLDLP